jgi:hypothetical protein
MEAIIFAGIQGAGKTTFYIQRLLHTHVRISLDLLGTRHRERLFLRTCLSSGQPFVVDNTNPTVAARAVYIQAAKAAHYKVTGYFFQTPLREALRRNAQRLGKNAIPVAGVVGTMKRFEIPTLAEGFDALFTVTPAPGGGFDVVQSGAAEGAAPDTPPPKMARSDAREWNDKEMTSGLTPGRYANRTGQYEVLTDGKVWLIGGADLPEGAPRKRVAALPGDAAMTNAAMDAPSAGGTTPPGKGPDPEQSRRDWEKGGR